MICCDFTFWNIIVYFISLQTRFTCCCTLKGQGLAQPRERVKVYFMYNEVRMVKSGRGGGRDYIAVLSRDVCLRLIHELSV